ncbi:hypothetical protein O2N63_16200 [Aliiroseovarius sp. KMU-50]|uniref:Uncharacterized protein n=1 Tax=Aliiroseovarius salicola TaxID=3009082 RepID=A0ABT4W540_9RHOB|nr:hypothetical protein [Aliiroseovarius sp. KMU-50]MDA5095633.1 hypothetical protein [Aliiroseovarius sp. KMU-50]
MDLYRRTARLARLMEHRLDVRGADFSAKVHRAGRVLPRHVRIEAERLVWALSMLDHPRLSQQIDMKEMAQAARIIEAYLLSVDPWDLRLGRVVDWAAGLAFSLLLLLALCLWILFWRGYL